MLRAERVPAEHTSTTLKEIVFACTGALQMKNSHLHTALLAARAQSSALQAELDRAAMASPPRGANIYSSNGALSSPLRGAAVAAAAASLGEDTGEPAPKKKKILTRPPGSSSFANPNMRKIGATGGMKLAPI